MKGFLKQNETHMIINQVKNPQCPELVPGSGLASSHACFVVHSKFNVIVPSTSTYSINFNRPPFPSSTSLSSFGSSSPPLSSLSSSRGRIPGRPLRRSCFFASHRNSITAFCFFPVLSGGYLAPFISNRRPSFCLSSGEGEDFSETHLGFKGSPVECPYSPAIPMALSIVPLTCSVGLYKRLIAQTSQKVSDSSSKDFNRLERRWVGRGELVEVR